jgi:hypothetical protein
MEILVEESSVQRVDAPVTVSFVLLQTPDLFFSDVHSAKATLRGHAFHARNSFAFDLKDNAGTDGHQVLL